MVNSSLILFIGKSKNQNCEKSRQTMYREILPKVKQNYLVQNFRMSIDFHYNKRVLDDVAVIPTKRIRNKIAGYATRLMRRIQTGPVRGISLKLQEEERERKMEYVPKESEFTLESTKIDEETKKMLEELGLNKLIKENRN